MLSFRGQDLTIKKVCTRLSTHVLSHTCTRVCVGEASTPGSEQHIHSLQFPRGSYSLCCSSHQRTTQNHCGMLLSITKSWIKIKRKFSLHS